MCQLHISLTRAAQIYLELHFCVELHTKKALWCALSSLHQSVARVKFEGAAPPKGRNVVSRKSTLWSIYTLGSITFSFMDQSPTFLTQRGRGGS